MCRYILTWFNSQWFDSKGFSSRYRAPKFEYEQGCPKGMHANPTEVFQGRMMQECRNRNGTRTLTYLCMHPPPHAHTYAHILARIPVCTDAHANTQRHIHAHAHVSRTYVHAQAHIHACMYEPQHACMQTHTYAHARTHVCIQP
jgi:hypothetical protein